MGCMELRAGAVGFRLVNLPLLLIASTTVLKVLNVDHDETLPNGSRNKETLNNKPKTQGESFLFLFLSKMGFRTYFVSFHTFSYKFR